MAERTPDHKPAKSFLWCPSCPWTASTILAPSNDATPEIQFKEKNQEESAEAHLWSFLSPGISMFVDAVDQLAVLVIAVGVHQNQ